MPYVTRKKKGDGYEVRSPHGVKAKRTTKAKAAAQVRLLNAIEHGYDPDEEKPHKRSK